MGDFLRFETMITPILIQIVFWISVVVCVVIGVIMLVSSHETTARIGGLLVLILGPIGARIYAEIFIIWFRMYDHLRQIDANTRHP